MLQAVIPTEQKVSERLQEYRAATMTLPSLKGVFYEERLERVGLPTLKERKKMEAMTVVPTNEGVRQSS